MNREYYDIAIISSYHQDVLSAEWFFAMESQGKKCIIITPNPNEHHTLKKQGAKSLYLKEFFPSKVPSRKMIEEYFRGKGIDDLAKYVSTEKSYYQQSNSHLSRYAFKYACAFEALFAKVSIETIIHPVQGGEVVRRTASLISNSLGINVIYLGETFIPGTVNLYSDEYRTVLKPIVDRYLTRERAQEIVDDKVRRKPVIYYETERRRFIQTSMPVKIFNLLRDGNWNIIRAYITRKKIISIDFLIREAYTRVFGVFKTFDPNDKYFYMPFNVNAESELFIRNYDFIDQVSVVDNLAKGLPDGYKLYVKIHPGREGHLSISSYRRLVKIKNVVPLIGKVNSFEVVEKSQGVVLISSTVGLESYIMGKPTCVIGHWPYVVYGNFITVNNLKEAFNTIQSRSTPNDPARFLQNLYKETVDGSLYAGSDDFVALINSILTMTYLRNK